MRNLYHFLKAMVIFARHQAWVDEPQWTPADAVALFAFLDSPAGARLRARLLNTVLRQQSNALNTTGNLVYEAGYCAGQKGLVAAIEVMADRNQFTEQGDTDADPATN